MKYYLMAKRRETGNVVCSKEYDSPNPEATLANMVFHNREGKICIRIEFNYGLDVLVDPPVYGWRMIKEETNDSK